MDDELIDASVKRTETIIAISKRHGLHYDQLGTLSDLIDAVEDGTLPAASFADAVRSKVTLDSAAAANIIKDVNEQIFKPVQNLLRSEQATADNGGIEEVHLSREELLHQLENPVPTPFSGRRTESGEARSTIQDSRMDTNTNDAVAAEMQKAIAAEQEQGTPVPINKPASPAQPQTILEKKLNSVTVTSKNTLPIDPYREATG